MENFRLLSTKDNRFWAINKCGICPHFRNAPHVLNGQVVSTGCVLKAARTLPDSDPPDWCPLPKLIRYEEPKEIGEPPFATIEEWDEWSKSKHTWMRVARNALDLLTSAIWHLGWARTMCGLRDMSLDHHDVPKEDDLEYMGVIDFLKRDFEEAPDDV